MTESLSDLHDRLDRSWVGYLNALENYTLAQQLLQKHMSSGFLSLARANFNARDGITRYGKDFYHERAVASRRIATTRSPQGEKTTLEFVQWEEPAKTDDDDGNDQAPLAGKADSFSGTDADDARPQQQPSPPSTPDAKDDDEIGIEKPKPSTQSEDASKFPSITKPSLASDPLRWFGILVPRELRLAQTSFKAVVDEPVLNAIAAARSMRDTETEIRKLRKEIRRAEKAQG